MQKQSPSITRLSVHLPNQQMCSYGIDDEIDNILEKSQHTTLTRWFETNKKNSATRNLKYINFTDKYVWSEALNNWTKRKRGLSVGRMYFVSPSENERFFLRLLLTHVSGATSYDDLKTVDNKLFPTFKEAAVALGLVEDDSHHDKCLKEASEIQTGRQLRSLFSIILCHCTVINPYKLWEKYIDSFCEDFLHHEQKENNNFSIKLNSNIIQKALIDIESNLRASQIKDKSLLKLQDFPDSVLELLSSAPETIIYNQKKVYDVEKLKAIAELNYSKFNKDQVQVFDEIYNSLISAEKKS
jgi:hypothetical protein